MAVYKDEQNGTWRSVYRYTDWTGEKKQTQKRGFLTRREALAWEREQMIKNAYNEVFTALKPNDLAAIGVFQRDSNQAKENADLFNAWDKEVNGAE